MLRIPRFQKKKTYAEEVLYESGDVLILNKEIVTTGNVLHDVSLDLLVLEDGIAIVDEDGRRGRLEIGAEVRRRLLHINGRHLQRDRLQLGEQIQIHEVLLTEQAGAFPATVDRRGLDIRERDQVLFFFLFESSSITLIISKFKIFKRCTRTFK